MARLRGESYQQIARRGGGIHSTVRKTRAADTEALYARCRLFLRQMLALGVTTVEAKSGYGLDAQTEARVLAVYARAGDAGARSGWCRPTWARTWCRPNTATGGPATWRWSSRRSPLFADEGLARFVDVFVEEGAFTVAEARRLAAAARVAGLGVKLHVDQLSAGGGAELAAEVGAVSADHLEHVEPARDRRAGAGRGRWRSACRSPRCTWARRRCRRGR